MDRVHLFYDFFPPGGAKSRMHISLSEKEVIQIFSQPPSVPGTLARFVTPLPAGVKALSQCFP